MTEPDAAVSDLANAYADARRARAYAALDYPGTYYLAFRDLPAILGAPAHGRTALDFGCGAGRSTRFLRSLGFDALGVDISADMIRQAEALDPGGRYLLIEDGDFGALPHDAFDAILCAFTFDNIPGAGRRVRLLRGLGERLRAGGRLVLLDSTPELYTHDWASFVTTPFPENARARSGGIVRVIMTDVEDRRPIEDVLWLDADYRAQLAEAGLTVEAVHRPLATPAEPFDWVNETEIAPWVIYAARRTA
jgi:SAM-dependent methyltransferase